MPAAVASAPLTVGRRAGPACRKGGVAGEKGFAGSWRRQAGHGYSRPRHAGAGGGGRGALGQGGLRAALVRSSGKTGARGVRGVYSGAAGQLQLGDYCKRVVNCKHIAAVALHELAGGGRRAASAGIYGGSCSSYRSSALFWSPVYRLKTEQGDE